MLLVTWELPADPVATAVAARTAVLSAVTQAATVLDAVLRSGRAWRPRFLKVDMLFLPGSGPITTVRKVQEPVSAGQNR